MERQPELLKRLGTASLLRDRWHTDVGMQIRSEILDRLRNKDDSWPALLDKLPNRSTENGLEDLRGINFDELDLEGIDLSFTDLSYAFVRKAQLKKICLQGSTLNWADFSGSDLTSADLLQATARSCRFERANLNDAMMLTGVFVDASFHSAVLRSAILDHANFTRADLTATDLEDAETRQTNFDKIIFSSDTKGIPLAKIAREMTEHHDEISKPTEIEHLEDFVDDAKRYEPVADAVIKLWADENRWESLLDEAFVHFLGVWQPEFAGLSDALYHRSAMAALRSADWIDISPDHYSVVGVKTSKGSTFIEWPEFLSYEHIPMGKVNRLRNLLVHSNWSIDNNKDIMKELDEIRKYFHSGASYIDTKILE